MINISFVKKLLSNKLAFAILAALGMVMIAVPTYAHYMYEYGYTSKEDTDCTWNRAEISHGSGGGYSETKVKSKQNWGDGECNASFPRPIYCLKVKWKLEKKNGSSWGTCHSSSSYYNGTTASRMTVGKDYGSNAPCGSGTYRTKAYGHLKTNGQWHGGSIYSGAFGHSLP